MGTSAVQINYDGSKFYSYHCGLIGLKYKYIILPQANVNVSYSQYWTKEKEDGDVTSDVVLFLNADDLVNDPDSIMTRKESEHNSITLESKQIKTGVNLIIQNNSIEFGGEVKFIDLTSNKDEYYVETGKLPLQNIRWLPKAKLFITSIQQRYLPTT